MTKKDRGSCINLAERPFTVEVATSLQVETNDNRQTRYERQLQKKLDSKVTEMLFVEIE